MEERVYKVVNAHAANRKAFRQTLRTVRTVTCGNNLIADNEIILWEVENNVKALWNDGHKINDFMRSVYGEVDKESDARFECGFLR